MPGRIAPLPGIFFLGETVAGSNYTSTATHLALASSVQIFDPPLVFSNLAARQPELFAADLQIGP